VKTDAGDISWKHRQFLRYNNATDHGVAFYRYVVLSALIALVYSTFLTLLPIDNFLDRINYFIYARTSQNIEVIYSQNFVSYLTNEPIWLLMNSLMYRFISDESIIRIFIFFPAFISAYLLAAKGRYNIFLVILALLVPGIIQNYIVHIRQGVAISIFMIGFLSNRKAVRYTMVSLTPFIHSAFFIVVALFFIVEILRFAKSINIYLRIFAVLICLLGITLFMGAIMSGALVRQVDEYQNVESSITGIGFLFWLSILIIFFSEGVAFTEKNMFQIFSMSFYLMIYFLAPFAGRILECVLIPVFMSGMMLSKWRRAAFISGLLLFSLQFYVSNSDLYWFGWGL
jgi:hypothetical protein